MKWIKCESGHMPEDDERYKGKKVINVLVTTDNGRVTKVQRIYWEYTDGTGSWHWSRVSAIAWMPLPEPYREM